MCQCIERVYAKANDNLQPYNDLTSNHSQHPAPSNPIHSKEA